MPRNKLEQNTSAEEAVNNVTAHESVGERSAAVFALVSVNIELYWKHFHGASELYLLHVHVRCPFFE